MRIRNLTLATVLVLIAAFWLPGMTSDSKATQLFPVITIPAGTAQAYDMVRCSAPNPAIYGITVGTVYCMKKYIGIAAEKLITYMADPTRTWVMQYQGAVYIMGLIILGIRIASRQTESIKKDSMVFLLKLASAILLVSTAPQLFIILSGMMGEMIGWVNNIFTISDPTNACVMLEPAKALLTAVDNTVNYDEYKVWHQIDCILMRMFGTTIATPSLATLQAALTGLGMGIDLTTTWNGLIATVPGWTSGNIPMVTQASMATIAMGAITLGALGAGMAALAIGLFVMFIKIIFQAVFFVLIAYLMIAMFAILTPIVAPLLVLQSHDNDFYTAQIFQRWINFVTGAVFQPPILLAFISFIALAADSFIEGDISNDPNIAPLYANCQPNSVGGGPCSFNQLFKTNTQAIAELASPPATAATLTLNGNFSHIMDPHPVVGNWRQQTADPQLSSNNCQLVYTPKAYIVNPVVTQANQVNSKASTVLIHGPERLKLADYMPILKFIITLITALIVLFILTELLHTMPSMVAKMVGGVGSAIMLASPIDSLLDKMRNSAIKGVKDGNEKFKTTFTNQGLRGVLTGGASGAAKGVQSAMQQFMKSLTWR